jgi:hypothetical protein
MHPDFHGFVSAMTTSPRDAKYASVDERFDLRNFLKEAGHETRMTLARSMKNDPKLAEAITRFYDFKDLFGEEAIKATKSAADGDKIIEDSGPDVTVVVRGEDPSTYPDLSDKEKEQLAQQEYVVRDKRESDATSRLYKTQINKQLCNPHMDGFYQVLMGKGRYRDCLVIRSPHSVGGYFAPQEGKMTVVDLENKAYGILKPTDLWTARAHEAGTWNNQWEDLAKAHRFHSHRAHGVKPSSRHAPRSQRLQPFGFGRLATRRAEAHLSDWQGRTEHRPDGRGSVRTQRLSLHQAHQGTQRSQDDRPRRAGRCRDGDLQERSCRRRPCSHAGHHGRHPVLGPC